MMRLPNPVSAPPLETPSSVLPEPDWMTTLQPEKVVVLVSPLADINQVFWITLLICACRPLISCCRLESVGPEPLCAPTGLRAERDSIPTTRAKPKPPSKRARRLDCR